MYKLTCGKCVVCFLFLVMVAFLSCSAFRIDSLDRRGAMGGFSDSSVSAASGVSGAAAAEAVAAGPRTARRHRLRHAKHYRSRAAAPPTSRIDVYVQEEPTAPSALDAQIPLPGAAAPSPTEPLTKRSQRSPAHHHQQQQQQQAKANSYQRGGGGGGGGRRAKPCQEQDVGRKAFVADTVVLAKAESMSMSRVRNYSVSFRILHRFKTSSFAVDDSLRLTFLNDTRRMNCESELGGGGDGGGVVKAQIRPAKEYYLFLNNQGNHNYTVVGAPVLNRRKFAANIERILRNVTRRQFEPKLKRPEVSKSEFVGKKVRFVCRVKGFPTPIIEWRKNETVLHSNSNIRITYRGKKSTLVIRNPDEKDSGWYTCVAHGVDKRREAASSELRIANSNSHEEKCASNLFCLNGGTCINMTDFKEPYCICSDGYTGKRCDQKTILEPQPSFMYEDD